MKPIEPLRGTPPPPVRRAFAKAEAPVDGVAPGRGPAIPDLRTAMRALEAASPAGGPEAETLWTAPANRFAFRAFASPTGQAVVVNNERSFAVHGPDGGFLEFGALPQGKASPTPSFRPDGGFYLASDEGVHCFQADGKPLWQRPAEGARAVVSGPDGTIYVESPQVLRAFSKEGEPLWDNLRTRPARSLAPVLTSDGALVTLEGDDSLLATNPDGAERWRRPDSAGLLGLAAGPDGTVHLLTREGELSQLGADGQVRWSVPVGGPTDRSRSVVVDGQGNVYVQGDEVSAWSAQGAPLFHQKRAGVYSLSGIPRGGVALSTAEGLVGLLPSGRTWWRVPAEPARSLSAPTFAPDGTLRTGGGQKLHALRMPEPEVEHLAERALQAAAAEGPAPEVVTGPQWVDIGGIRLPVRG